VEFAAAISILVGFLIIPLIDFAVVPIRWMLAQELVNDYARKLALSEKFSQSFARMEADPSLRTRLQRLGGVTANSVSLHLRISRVNKRGDEIVCERPLRVPPAWLPDNAMSPCAYSLELIVDASISPAILFSLDGVSIPGLTTPIPIMIKASHEWGNLSRNPSSGEFFINE